MQPVGVTAPVAELPPAEARRGSMLPFRSELPCRPRMALLELGNECGANEGGRVFLNGEPLVALSRSELLTCGGAIVA